MLEAAERFVSEVRALCAQEMSDEERWTKTGELLRDFASDAEVQEHAKNWPATDRTSTGRDRTGNLLFYEDPDYGFLVTAMAKEAGHHTTVHDHGAIWTMYGLVQGAEDINRFHRERDEVVHDSTFRIEPGDVDVVPPHLAHQEITIGERSAAIIIRSEKRARGAELIPYALEATGG
ncbi:MAG: hypothetical protein F4Z88_10510 [Chloroflexi bacterium]|nr:hypothetical protein [Chloroflexota bacterium]